MNKNLETFLKVVVAFLIGIGSGRPDLIFSDSNNIPALLLSVFITYSYLFAGAYLIYVFAKLIKKYKITKR